MAKKTIEGSDNIVQGLKDSIIINFPKYSELYSELLDYLIEDKITKKQSNDVIDFYYEQEKLNKRTKKYVRRYNRLFKNYMNVWLTQNEIYDLIGRLKGYGFIETELKGTTYDVSVVPRTIILKKEKGISKKKEEKILVYIVITLYVERNKSYRITINAVDKVF